jgi:hypothetical protein
MTPAELVSKIRLLERHIEVDRQEIETLAEERTRMILILAEEVGVTEAARMLEMDLDSRKPPPPGEDETNGE